MADIKKFIHGLNMSESASKKIANYKDMLQMLKASSVKKDDVPLLLGTIKSDLLQNNQIQSYNAAKELWDFISTEMYEGTQICRYFELFLSKFEIGETEKIKYNITVILYILESDKDDVVLDLIGAEAPKIELIKALKTNYQNVPLDMCFKFVHFRLLPQIFSKSIDTKDKNEIIDLIMSLPLGFACEYMKPEEKAQLKEDIMKVYLLAIRPEGNISKWWNYCKVLIHYCGKLLHSEIELTNAILRRVECGFKAKIIESRAGSYECWKVLIENYNLDPKYLRSAKQISLLIKPLKAKLSKNSIVSIKRFEAFTCFIEYLENYSVPCLQEFLSFSFGPFHEDYKIPTDITNNQYFPGRLTQEIYPYTTEILLKLIGHDKRKCSCNSENTYLTDVYTIKPFLNADNINEHFEVFVNSVRICTLLIDEWTQGSNRNVLIDCLWDTLFLTIRSCADVPIIVLQNVLLNIKSIIKTCLNYDKYYDILNCIVRSITKYIKAIDYNEEICKQFVYPLIYEVCACQVKNRNSIDCNVTSLFNYCKEGIDFYKTIKKLFMDTIPKCDLTIKLLKCTVMKISNSNVKVDQETKDVIYESLIWLLDNDTKECYKSWKIAADGKLISVFSEIKYKLLEALKHKQAMENINIIQILRLFLNTISKNDKQFVNDIIITIRYSLRSLSKKSINDNISILKSLVDIKVKHKFENFRDFCICFVDLLKQEVYSVLSILKYFVQNLTALEKNEFSQISLYGILNGLIKHPEKTVSSEVSQILKMLEVTDSSNMSRGAKIRNMVTTKISPCGSPRSNLMHLFNESTENIFGSMLNKTSKTSSSKFVVLNGSPISSKNKIDLNELSDADFVRIDAEVFIDKNKMSEHQKEVASKRRDDIPALYEDLTQSSMDCLEAKIKIDSSNENTSLKTKDSPDDVILTSEKCTRRTRRSTHQIENGSSDKPNVLDTSNDSLKRKRKSSSDELKITDILEDAIKSEVRKSVDNSDEQIASGLTDPEPKNKKRRSTFKINNLEKKIDDNIVEESLDPCATDLSDNVGKNNTRINFKIIDLALPQKGRQLGEEVNNSKSEDDIPISSRTKKMVNISDIQENLSLKLKAAIAKSSVPHKRTIYFCKKGGKPVSVASNKISLSVIENENKTDKEEQMNKNETILKGLPENMTCEKNSKDNKNEVLEEIVIKHENDKKRDSPNKKGVTRAETSISQSNDNVKLEHSKELSEIKLIDGNIETSTIEDQSDISDGNSTFSSEMNSDQNNQLQSPKRKKGRPRKTVGLTRALDILKMNIVGGDEFQNLPRKRKQKVQTNLCENSVPTSTRSRRLDITVPKSNKNESQEQKLSKSPSNTKSAESDSTEKSSSCPVKENCASNMKTSKLNYCELKTYGNKKAKNKLDENVDSTKKLINTIAKEIPNDKKIDLKSKPTSSVDSESNSKLNDSEVKTYGKKKAKNKLDENVDSTKKLLNTLDKEIPNDKKIDSKSKPTSSVDSESNSNENGEAVKTKFGDKLPEPTKNLIKLVEESKHESNEGKKSSQESKLDEKAITTIKKSANKEPNLEINIDSMKKNTVNDNIKEIDTEFGQALNSIDVKKQSTSKEMKLSEIIIECKENKSNKSLALIEDTADTIKIRSKSKKDTKTTISPAKTKSVTDTGGDCDMIKDNTIDQHEGKFREKRSPKNDQKEILSRIDMADENNTSQFEIKLDDSTGIKRRSITKSGITITLKKSPKTDSKNESGNHLIAKNTRANKSENKLNPHSTEKVLASNEGNEIILEVNEDSTTEKIAGVSPNIIESSSDDDAIRYPSPVSVGSPKKANETSPFPKIHEVRVALFRNNFDQLSPEKINKISHLNEVFAQNLKDTETMDIISQNDTSLKISEMDTETMNVTGDLSDMSLVLDIEKTPERSVNNDTLVSSPISYDTPTRNNELLKNTLDISPIKVDNDKCSKVSPDIYTSQKEEAVQDDALRGETEDVSTTKTEDAGTSKSLKLESEIIVLKGPSSRSAKLLNLVPQALPIKTHKTVLHSISRAPQVSSPTTERIKRMMLNCEEQNQTELPANVNEEEVMLYVEKDILKFEKEVPSPLATPKVSILKRKLPETIEDGLSPCAKRKRVNFSDPPTTSEKIYFKEIEEKSHFKKMKKKSPKKLQYKVHCQTSEQEIDKNSEVLFDDIKPLEEFVENESRVFHFVGQSDLGETEIIDPQGNSSNGINVLSNLIIKESPNKAKENKTTIKSYNKQMLKMAKNMFSMIKETTPEEEYTDLITNFIIETLPREKCTKLSTKLLKMVKERTPEEEYTEIITELVKETLSNETTKYSVQLVEEEIEVIAGDAKEVVVNFTD